MQRISLTALMRHQLKIARESTSGRSAKTVLGGHERVMRQTMIALRADEVLNECESPGDASVQVLYGRVSLKTARRSWTGAEEVSWSGSVGDLLFIPETRYSLTAAEDSVVLFTVAKVAAPRGQLLEQSEQELARDLATTHLAATI